MIKTTIRAYDGSKPSEKNFRFALDSVAKFTAEITTVSVAGPGEPAVAVELHEMLENTRDNFEGHYN